MAANLTTLKAVKEWASIEGSSDDALLERLIKAASSYIALWCSRTFEVTNVTEFYDGNGRRQIAVRNYPILSVSAVRIDGVAVPASSAFNVGGYYFDNFSISLRGDYKFSRGPANVEVSYSYGFAEVPDDLEQACIEMVLARYRDKNRLGLQTQSIHGEAVSYNPSELSAFARAVLAQYKRVVPL